MRFHDLPGEAPAGFATDEFVLRPITVADVEADYAAVMESRVELRPWEQTGWPAEDFTVGEDLADLEGLERRHGARDAFTYTVVTPDGATCLGCVYVMPPDARTYADARIEPAGDADWSGCDGAVYFWVRTSRLGDGLDARLLDALRGWLADAWPLRSPVFCTNEECAHQVRSLEAAGLRRRFTITKPDQAPFLAFACTREGA